MQELKISGLQWKYLSILIWLFYIWIMLNFSLFKEWCAFSIKKKCVDPVEGVD